MEDSFKFYILSLKALSYGRCGPSKGPPKKHFKRVWQKRQWQNDGARLNQWRILLNFLFYPLRRCLTGDVAHRAVLQKNILRGYAKKKAMVKWRCKIKPMGILLNFLFYPLRRCLTGDVAHRAVLQKNILRGCGKKKTMAKWRCKIKPMEDSFKIFILSLKELFYGRCGPSSGPPKKHFKGVWQKKGDGKMTVQD